MDLWGLMVSEIWKETDGTVYQHIRISDHEDTAVMQICKYPALHMSYLFFFALNCELNQSKVDWLMIAMLHV